MISINSHPNMSTAFNPGHKATNQIDKIYRDWPFWDVLLQFNINVMHIKFYVILFVL